jgi:hypothetical protein
MAIAKAASMLGVTLKTYHKTVDKILEMAWYYENRASVSQI